MALPLLGEAACPRWPTALRPPRRGGWLASESVAALRRNHRLASIGITGCFASERAPRLALRRQFRVTVPILKAIRHFLIDISRQRNRSWVRWLWHDPVAEGFQ